MPRYNNLAVARRAWEEAGPPPPLSCHRLTPHVSAVSRGLFDWCTQRPIDRPPAWGCPGDYYPTSHFAKVFAIVFLPLSTLLLGKVISDYTEVSAARTPRGAMKNAAVTFRRSPRKSPLLQQRGGRLGCDTYPPTSILAVSSFVPTTVYRKSARVRRAALQTRAGPGNQVNCRRRPMLHSLTAFRALCAPPSHRAGWIPSSPTCPDES